MMVSATNLAYLFMMATASFGGPWPVGRSLKFAQKEPGGEVMVALVGRLSGSVISTLKRTERREVALGARAHVHWHS